MSLDYFTLAHVSLRRQNGRLASGTYAVRNLDDEAISCLMFVTVLLSQFRDHYLQTEQTSDTGFSSATQIIISKKPHCVLSTPYSCQTDNELHTYKEKHSLIREYNNLKRNGISI